MTSLDRALDALESAISRRRVVGASSDPLKRAETLLEKVTRLATPYWLQPLVGERLQRVARELDAYADAQVVEPVKRRARELAQKAWNLARAPLFIALGLWWLWSRG